MKTPKKAKLVRTAVAVASTLRVTVACYGQPGTGDGMWRATDDIDDSYGRMIAIGFSQAGLAPFAGPRFADRGAVIAL
jgi:hypothetical protein